MPQGEPQTKSQTESGPGPEAEYRSRLSALDREQTELHESDRRYVGLKLVLLAALVIVAAWLVKYAPGRLPWLALIVAALVVAFVLHERVLRRIRTARQRKGFYERGGFYLASIHARKEVAPRGVVFVHAGVAVIGFLLLLGGTFHFI